MNDLRDKQDRPVLYSPGNTVMHIARRGRERPLCDIDGDVDWEESTYEREFSDRHVCFDCMAILKILPSLAENGG